MWLCALVRICHKQLTIINELLEWLLAERNNNVWIRIKGYKSYIGNYVVNYSGPVSKNKGESFDLGEKV